MRENCGARQIEEEWGEFYFQSIFRASTSFFGLPMVYLKNKCFQMIIIISTDEDPSLRIESFATINLRVFPNLCLEIKLCQQN